MAPMLAAAQEYAFVHTIRADSRLSFARGGARILSTTANPPTRVSQHASATVGARRMANRARVASPAGPTLARQDLSPPPTRRHEKRPPSALQSRPFSRIWKGPKSAAFRAILNVYSET